MFLAEAFWGTTCPLPCTPSVCPVDVAGCPLLGYPPLPLAPSTSPMFPRGLLICEDPSPFSLSVAGHCSPILPTASLSYVSKTKIPPPSTIERNKWLTNNNSHGSPTKARNYYNYTLLD